MRKNNRVVPWFTGSGSILTLAGAVMLMLAWGCSKSADTPPEKPPAAPAASPEAGAPQAVAETPAPQPAAAPVAPPAAANNPPPAAAPAATKAPDGSAAPADSEATKRLIEEKLKQLQSSAPTPAAGQRGTPPPPAGAPSVPASGAQAAPQPVPPPAPAAGDQKPGRTPILDGESLDMAPPPPDQPQPRAVYDRELIVADPIWRGESAKFLFNVRNEGEGVLNMKMKACCGLSINGVRNGWPGWSLKPGESETFEMTFGPSARGDFTRYSPLHTNDPQNPKINFTLKGRVLVAFNVEPHVVNLGVVQPDSGPITKTVTITRGDGGRLQPKLNPPKDPRVKAELQEVEPGERYTLEVTVTPPLPHDYRSSLVLDTGLSQAPRETILIVTQQEQH